MQRKIKIDRRKSASSVKAEMASELEIIVSEQTVCCRLHEVGFKGRVARKNPRMDKANWIKRIEYARKFREKPSDFWITCCELMKVDLTCMGPTANLWSGERLKKHGPKYIVPTLKRGGKNVKCWGCLSSSVVENLVFVGRKTLKERFIVLFYKKKLFESVKTI